MLASFPDYTYVSLLKIFNVNAHITKLIQNTCHLKHRYYTNNTGLEALFVDSIAVYISKTMLLIFSRIYVVAGDG